MSCHALITIARIVDLPSCPTDLVFDHCFSARIRPSNLNNFVRNILLYDMYAPCRPLPNHSYVEDYIRAYYLSESDTDEWLRKHQVSE